MRPTLEVNVFSTGTDLLARNLTTLSLDTWATFTRRKVIGGSFCMSHTCSAVLVPNELSSRLKSSSGNEHRTWCGSLVFCVCERHRSLVKKVLRRFTQLCGKGVM